MSRILVVEDEAHLAEGLRFNLAAEGHAVEIARDGADAARRLADAGAGFELVILDLMLPEMSGFEVLRRARAAGNYVPILILTAKDDTQDLVRGLEEGDDDYLTKPFRLDELLARVRGLLRRAVRRACRRPFPRRRTSVRRCWRSRQNRTRRHRLMCSTRFAGLAPARPHSRLRPNRRVRQRPARWLPRPHDRSDRTTCASRHPRARRRPPAPR